MIAQTVDRWEVFHYNARMPLLIDGHNLIPKIPGLHLSDPDDELRLVEMLQTYSRTQRKGPIECFFDKAPAGLLRSQMVGGIKVLFARSGQTADAEIEARLAQLGRQARNWVVVSADQRVRQAGRAVGAQDMSTDAFAKELLAALKQTNEPAKPSQGKPEDRKLSSDEVEQWMEMFRKGREEDDR
jgi:predicted RNA-binding protein with PIN domain